jgi:Transglycosylase-like domain
MRTLVCGLVAACGLVLPAEALAHDGGSIAHKNKYLRAKVMSLYNKRAPGCNLVAGQCKGHAHPKKAQIKRYFGVMRRMIVSRSAARLLRAGKPYQPPAGTATARAPAGGTLANIRACESGGNYSTNTGNGFYGAYQFTLQTWASVGGSGNPANASPAEQDKRAAMLYAREGAAPWPVCGR